MHLHRTRRELIVTVSAGAAILLTAFLLKVFYSRASSDDLAWIIAPTALLIESISSLSFIKETGYGWVDPRQGVVIAPACAGVNFLIISFLMSSFHIVSRAASTPQLITGAAVAASASYLLTVFANTARITLSVALFNLDMHCRWLTPDQMHRITGIAVYYLFLCLYSAVITVYPRPREPRAGAGTCPVKRQGALAAPLFWYLSISLGVPVLHGAFRDNPAPFATHALSVAAVTVFLSFAALMLRKWMIRR